MHISQVGYKRNDAYTSYINMGSPPQLSKTQVEVLKSQALGKPQEKRNLRVNADGRLHVSLPLRENDVYLVKLQPAS
jgi:xylan 1,4-beta-xylosidase